MDVLDFFVLLVYNVNVEIIQNVFRGIKAIQLLLKGRFV